MKVAEEKNAGPVIDCMYLSMIKQVVIRLAFASKLSHRTCHTYMLFCLRYPPHVPWGYTIGGQKNMVHNLDSGFSRHLPSCP